MRVRKLSPVSGKYNEMELPITQEQIDRWQGGELAQNAFPHLTADQREFLISGITAEEWETLYPKKDA